MHEKLALLRAEDIKAQFLLYGHTVFALHCQDYWTGFHWHAHRNFPRVAHDFGSLQDAREIARRTCK